MALTVGLYPTQCPLVTTQIIPNQVDLAGRTTQQIGWLLSKSAGTPLKHGVYIMWDTHFNKASQKITKKMGTFIPLNMARFMNVFGIGFLSLTY